MGYTLNANRSLAALSEIRQQAAMRCLAYQEQSHNQQSLVYAMTTALQLLGVELPYINVRKYPRLDKAVIQVAVKTEGDKRRRSRKSVPIEYFAWNIPIEVEEIARDIRCVSPVCTWFMMANYLSLEELVILGDNILRRQVLHDVCRRVDFEDYLDRLETLPNRKRAPRGIVKARQALHFMREGTDSSQETRLRLRMEQHGLPVPEVNYELVTVRRHRYWLDMAFPKEGIAVEYDGMLHRDQWQHDADRRSEIEGSEWFYVQVTNHNLRDEEQEDLLMETIARYLRERGRNVRPHPRADLEAICPIRSSHPRIGRRHRNYGPHAL